MRTGAWQCLGGAGHWYGRVGGGSACGSAPGQRRGTTCGKLCLHHFVSDRLRASDADLANTPCPVLRFKGVLPVKQILATADTIAG